MDAAWLQATVDTAAEFFKGCSIGIGKLRIICVTQKNRINFMTIMNTHVDVPITMMETAVDTLEKRLAQVLRERDHFRDGLISINTRNKRLEIRSAHVIARDVLKSVPQPAKE